MNNYFKLCNLVEFTLNWLFWKDSLKVILFSANAYSCCNGKVEGSQTDLTTKFSLIVFIQQLFTKYSSAVLLVLFVIWTTPSISNIWSGFNKFYFVLVDNTRNTFLNSFGTTNTDTTNVDYFIGFKCSKHLGYNVADSIINSYF